MIQPLPTNLHPSQCYRILDPKLDTLQDGDEILLNNSGAWRAIMKEHYHCKPSKHETYRRPFTPPAPVQVQEFWRLLEIGKDTLQAGDQVKFRLTVDGWQWEEIDRCRHGESPHKNHVYRRRVTVPVAPKAEPVTESGPYLVSVDGHEAPTMEHSTIEEARIEAERLACHEYPARVRILRQVAVAKSDVMVKWEESK